MPLLTYKILPTQMCTNRAGNLKEILWFCQAWANNQAPSAIILPSFNTKITHFGYPRAAGEKHNLNPNLFSKKGDFMDPGWEQKTTTLITSKSTPTYLTAKSQSSDLRLVGEREVDFWTWPTRGNSEPGARPARKKEGGGSFFPLRVPHDGADFFHYSIIIITTFPSHEQ